MGSKDEVQGDPDLEKRLAQQESNSRGLDLRILMS